MQFGMWTHRFLSEWDTYGVLSPCSRQSRRETAAGDPILHAQCPTQRVAIADAVLGRTATGTVRPFHCRPFRCCLNSRFKS